MADTIKIMASLKQKEEPQYESVMDFFDRVRQLVGSLVKHLEIKEESLSSRENLIMDNFVKVIFVYGLRPAIGRMMTTTDETSSLEQVVMAADRIEKTEHSYTGGPAAKASAIQSFEGFYRGRGQARQTFQQPFQPIQQGYGIYARGRGPVANTSEGAQYAYYY